MDYIEITKKAAQEYAAELTRILEKKKTDPNYLITYVYFMKLYYEFMFHYKLFKKTKEVRPEKVKRVVEEMIKTMALIKDVPPAQLKAVSGGGQITFYKQHKAKMAKWTKNTPRNQIIKTLELWTGQKGEDAVIETIYRLQDDSQDIFSFVLNSHGLSGLTNNNIKTQIYQSLISLFKYYTRHRGKYMEAIDAKKMKVDETGLQLSLRDKYINTTIKMKGCDFAGFYESVKKLIAGLDKLDVDIVAKLIEENPEPVEDTEYLFYRRDLKNKILESAAVVAEDLECFTPAVDIDIAEARQTVPGLLDLVGRFIEAEKEVEKNLELIKENAELQISNIGTLLDHIVALVGPDTRPCVRRAAPIIAGELKKNGANFKGRKITKEGRKRISEFICSSSPNKFGETK